MVCLCDCDELICAFFFWMNTVASKDASGELEMSDKTGNECLGERAKKKLKRFFRKRL